MVRPKLCRFSCQDNHNRFSFVLLLTPLLIGLGIGIISSKIKEIELRPKNRQCASTEDFIQETSDILQCTDCPQCNLTCVQCSLTKTCFSDRCTQRCILQQELNHRQTVFDQEKCQDIIDEHNKYWFYWQYFCVMFIVTLVILCITLVIKTN